MIEIKGDFWEHAKNDYEVLVCTTNCVLKNNGELVMGAGIAKQFASKIPVLPKLWGERAKRIQEGRLKSCVAVVLWDLFGKYLVAFPTKYHWKEKSDLKLIERSAFQLLTITEAFGWKKILMTRPGCGKGGLNWEEVEPILKRWLDSRFYVVSI
jgi:O-acetyl-ADP-ribose deacetylase (regulator of RNase III)